MTLLEKEMSEEWGGDGRGAAISVWNLRAFDSNIFISPTVVKQQSKWRKISCQIGFQIKERRKSVFHDIKLGTINCWGNYPGLSLLWCWLILAPWVHHCRHLRIIQLLQTFPWLKFDKSLQITHCQSFYSMVQKISNFKWCLVPLKIGSLSYLIVFAPRLLFPHIWELSHWNLHGLHYVWVLKGRRFQAKCMTLFTNIFLFLS